MKHRHYILLLSLPLLIMAPLAVWLTTWIQPLTGDLTRVGGYPEAWFGWNTPQRAFTDIPLKMPDDPDTFDGQADLVAIGDSFTLYRMDLRPWSWPLHFQDKTGLSVALYNRHYWPPKRFLESRHYREHPPAVLVFETAEREFDDWLSAPLPGDCGAPVNHPPLQWHPRPANLAHTLQARPTGHATLNEAMSLIRQQALFWDNTTRRLTLSRDDLFSSAHANQLLVLKSEFRKYRHSAAEFHQLGCYFLDMQRAVEANGVTRFVLMIVPDKLSVYGPYLAGSKQYQPVIPELAVPGLSLLRLDTVLGDAVARGIPDVYWPNDTHWGSEGSALVAQALADYLNGIAAVQETPTATADASNALPPAP